MSERGEAGARGPQGSQGREGAQGREGLQGVEGVGSQGEPGETGARGPKGGVVLHRWQIASVFVVIIAITTFFFLRLENSLNQSEDALLEARTLSRQEARATIVRRLENAQGQYINCAEAREIALDRVAQQERDIESGLTKRLLLELFNQTEAQAAETIRFTRVRIAEQQRVYSLEGCISGPRKRAIVITQIEENGWKKFFADVPKRLRPQPPKGGN